MTLIPKENHMPTVDELLTPLRHCRERLTFTGRLADVASAALDLVGPAPMLSMDVDRLVHLSARSPESPLLLPDGVAHHLPATPTRTALRHLAERFRIPLPYLDRLLAEHPDLAATNINVLAARDERTFLYRLLKADDGYALRAVLSDRYRALDDRDAFVTVAQGMQDSGLDLGDCDVEVDWTPDRFRMRVAIPQVSVLAADVLEGYRGRGYTFTPGRGIHEAARADEVPPVLWAGLEVTNGETGGSAFVVTPRAVVLICRNGLTRTVDALRSVHLGARLEAGAVDWSAATQARARDLALSMVADATRRFCSAEYLEHQVNEMRSAKGIAVASPTHAVEVLGRVSNFTEAECASVLDAFVLGGDTSVLGLAQAVTAAAQDVADGDRQAEMEAEFWGIVGAPERFVGAS